MFTNKELSVGDWWLFWILMLIPIVNIIVFINILLSSSVNKTLKNHVKAIILPFVIIFVLAIATGFLGGLFDKLLGS